MRRTMETYSKTSRFILSANYSSRLIEPIQSRTAVFRFRPLKPEAIREYVSRIAKAEKLKITDEGMDALVYVAEGDMRRAVNSLQVAASLGPAIDADVLYKVASTIRPEEVKKLIEKALEGEFLRAREVLDRLLIEYGLSGEDIVRQLHRSVFDLNVPEDQVDAVVRDGRVPTRVVREDVQEPGTRIASLQVRPHAGHGLLRSAAVEGPREMAQFLAFARRFRDMGLDGRGPGRTDSEGGLE